MSESIINNHTLVGVSGHSYQFAETGYVCEGSRPHQRIDTQKSPGWRGPDKPREEVSRGHDSQVQGESRLFSFSWKQIFHDFWLLWFYLLYSIIILFIFSIFYWFRSYQWIQLISGYTWPEKRPWSSPLSPSFNHTLMPGWAASLMAPSYAWRNMAALCGFMGKWKAWFLCRSCQPRMWPIQKNSSLLARSETSCTVV